MVSFSPVNLKRNKTLLCVNNNIANTQFIMIQNDKKNCFLKHDSKLAKQLYLNDFIYPVVLFILHLIEWSGFTEALFGSFHDDPPSSDNVSSCIRNSWAVDTVKIYLSYNEYIFFKISHLHWLALHFDNL